MCFLCGRSTRGLGLCASCTVTVLGVWLYGHRSQNLGLYGYMVTVLGPGSGYLCVLCGHSTRGLGVYASYKYGHSTRGLGLWLYDHSTRGLGLWLYGHSTRGLSLWLYGHSTRGLGVYAFCTVTVVGVWVSGCIVIVLGVWVSVLLVRSQYSGSPQGNLCCRCMFSTIDWEEYYHRLSATTHTVWWSSFLSFVPETAPFSLAASLLSPCLELNEQF